AKALAASTSPTATAAPGASTHQSTCVPNPGSSRRASPTGNRDERTTLLPTATTTVTTVVNAIGSSTPLTTFGPVNPIARRAGTGSVMAYTVLVSAWPTNTIP